MFVGTRILAIVAMVALAFVMSPPVNNTEAGVPAELKLDFNISDGACVDIDPGPLSTTVGSSVQVAVCLTNPFSEEIATFNYEVLYNDTIVLAPEVADSGTSLDDNPDANVGSTTFTSGTYPSALDSDFDCGFALLDPKGDNDPAPGAGRAFSGACFVPTVPGVTGLVSGPLGVITFDALSVGSTSLTIANAAVGDEFGAELGSCHPIIVQEMICTGGDINVFAAVDLSLDFDISDGACVDPTPAVNVTVGESVQVAVCLNNTTGNDIDHFVLYVAYDNAIVSAPEVAKQRHRARRQSGCERRHHDVYIRDVPRHAGQRLGLFNRLLPDGRHRRGLARDTVCFDRAHRNA